MVIMQLESTSNRFYFTHFNWTNIIKGPASQAYIRFGT